uniref:MH2 domain-containing protein n=1 Tax=Steinernema glaseri TaxID=37863 RepID=A0A1I8APV8_9BILA
MGRVCLSAAISRASLPPPPTRPANPRVPGRHSLFPLAEVTDFGSDSRHVAMPLNRSELIERLLASAGEEALEEPMPSAHRLRHWSSFDQCVKDNLFEVQAKLSNIENQIWGKLIVMERNYRTAKAYLRYQSILVDGSQREFDGARLGLSRFSPDLSDRRLLQEYRRLDKGVEVQIDERGNVWVSKNCEKTISVRTPSAPTVDCVGFDPIKVFDLGAFKEIVVREIGRPKPNLERLFRMTTIQINLCSSVLSYLESPCWLLLIHLIAVDMVSVLDMKKLPYSPTNRSLTSTSDLASNTSSSHDSHESYSSPQATKFTKRGVARRLQHGPTTAPRSHYQKVARAPSEEPKLPDSLPKPSSLGWSMLDLSDLNRQQRPAFFHPGEEDCRPNRGGAGHPFKSYPTHWKSETCLKYI